MSSLSEEEIDQVAMRLVAHVKAAKHEFWIDPEEHYKAHHSWSRMSEQFPEEKIRDLHDMLLAYKNARSLFWKAFLGFAIIGTLVLVGIGVSHGGR